VFGADESLRKVLPIANRVAWTLGGLSLKSPTPILLHDHNTLLLADRGDTGSIAFYSPHTHSLSSELEVLPHNRVSKRSQSSSLPAPRIYRVDLSGDTMVTMETLTGATGFNCLKFWRRGDKGGWSVQNAKSEPHGRGVEVSALALWTPGTGQVGSKLCATVGESDLGIWDASGGTTKQDAWRCATKAPLPGMGSDAVQFSADGTVLVVFRGGIVSIWDARGGVMITKIHRPGFKSSTGLHLTQSSSEGGALGGGIVLWNAHRVERHDLMELTGCIMLSDDRNEWVYDTSATTTTKKTEIVACESYGSWLVLALYQKETKCTSVVLLEESTGKKVEGFNAWNIPGRVLAMCTTNKSKDSISNINMETDMIYVVTSHHEMHQLYLNNQKSIISSTAHTKSIIQSNNEFQTTNEEGMFKIGNGRKRISHTPSLLSTRGSKRIRNEDDNSTDNDRAPLVDPSTWGKSILSSTSSNNNDLEPLQILPILSASFVQKYVGAHLFRTTSTLNANRTNSNSKSPGAVIMDMIGSESDKINSILKKEKKKHKKNKRNSNVTTQS